MSADATIALADLHVDLGGRAVLRGISVAVRPCDCVAIVGRNAAGKTTLLRAMAGLIAPRGGSALLDGRDVGSLPPRTRARRLALVAQRPLVAAAFSVRESVALGRFARSRAEHRIDEAIALLGLEAERDRPYHELSVGQQQRAALARAFAQAEPDSVLLLDEPFAAMDLGEVARCAPFLRGHAAGGGAVVAVLHDLAQAAALARRVWVLDEGRLVADGPVGEVLVPERLSRWFGVPFEHGPHGPIARLHSTP